MSQIDFQTKNFAAFEYIHAFHFSDPFIRLMAFHHIKFYIFFVRSIKLKFMSIGHIIVFDWLFLLTYISVNIVKWNIRLTGKREKVEKKSVLFVYSISKHRFIQVRTFDCSMWYTYLYVLDRKLVRPLNGESNQHLISFYSSMNMEKKNKKFFACQPNAYRFFGTLNRVYQMISVCNFSYFIIFAFPSFQYVHIDSVIQIMFVMLYSFDLFYFCLLLLLILPMV